MISFYLPIIDPAYQGFEVAEHARELFEPAPFELMDDIEDLVWAEMKTSESMPDFESTYKAVVNKYAAEVVARHITNVTITSDEDALYIDDTAINNAAALDKAIKQLSDKVA